MPTAHFAFLDEIWKSSPAILNTLLTIINERIYRDGNKDIKVPLKGIVCASNEFPPDNQGLEAIYDRMILRYFVKPLEERENFEKLFKSKKSNDIKPLEPFSISELEQIAIKSQDIKFEQKTMDAICNLKSQIQLLNQDKEYRKKLLASDEYKPIYISDRRWKQCAELLQTAALLSDRDTVQRYDLALLAHLLWSSEEDKVIIEKILFNVLNENSNFDSELQSLKEDNLSLKNLIEKNLYSPNGKPKKVDNKKTSQYLQISKDQITKANNLKNSIEAEFQKAKAGIKNPFLSQNDIELSLSSYTLSLKEVNNEILKAKELENIIQNQPISKKFSNSTEYKYHPKTNKELRDLVYYETVKLSEIDISEVSDFSNLFKDSKRSDFSGIEEWDVSHVTNMSCMFYGVENFNSDISSWDVSNVTDMSGMFYGAENFNSDISSWDVSNATNMSCMFYNAKNFNSDISSWDVSNATNMSCMFQSADNFNQPLNNWDVSNVKNIRGMFFKAKSFNQTLASWKISINDRDLKADTFYGSAQNPLPLWYK